MRRKRKIVVVSRVCSTVFYCVLLYLKKYRRTKWSKRRIEQQKESTQTSPCWSRWSPTVRLLRGFSSLCWKRSVECIRVCLSFTFSLHLLSKDGKYSIGISLPRHFCTFILSSTVSPFLFISLQNSCVRIFQQEDPFLSSDLLFLSFKFFNQISIHSLLVILRSSSSSSSHFSHTNSDKICTCLSSLPIFSTSYFSNLLTYLPCLRNTRRAKGKVIHQMIERKGTVW